MHIISGPIIEEPAHILLVLNLTAMAGFVVLFPRHDNRSLTECPRLNQLFGVRVAGLTRIGGVLLCRTKHHAVSCIAALGKLTESRSG
ncbi:hypothetical protein N431DRAFT_241746 [Stipitochalara longipes BDJ]|nr:hypothetical protein N431DRAFT_241746 [Stipitochalara longipes BDJ]